MDVRVSLSLFASDIVYLINFTRAVFSDVTWWIASPWRCLVRHLVAHLFPLRRSVLRTVYSHWRDYTFKFVVCRVRVYVTPRHHRFLQ
jgi:hypothetical protein